jgi:hypothetical protein
LAASKAAVELAKSYLARIKKELESGDATEHTHRPALKDLIEGLKYGVTATNEPKRVTCGAPDFVVKKRDLSIGYVEAKDIGKSLDEAESSEQLKRYRESLHNLILTDYLEFRWYVDDKFRDIGNPSINGAMVDFKTITLLKVICDFSQRNALEVQIKSGSYYARVVLHALKPFIWHELSRA